MWCPPPSHCTGWKTKTTSQNPGCTVSPTNAVHWPCGEAGVICVTQNLVRVTNGNHSVSDQLEAHALVLWRLVYWKQTNKHSWTIWYYVKKSSGHVSVLLIGLVTPWSLWGHTRQSVVHVKAVAFDVLQCQTSVDKNPVSKHREHKQGSYSICGWLVWLICFKKIQSAENWSRSSPLDSSLLHLWLLTEEPVFWVTNLS